MTVVDRDCRQKREARKTTARATGTARFACLERRALQALHWRWNPGHHFRYL